MVPAASSCDLTDPHTPVNLRQLGNQIVVDFAGADRCQQSVRRFDVGRFRHAGSGFDVVKRAATARAWRSPRRAISSSSPTRPTISTSSKCSRPARPSISRRRRSDYTGERLTLNFQDIETRAVLQLLADASGQNIVVCDSVQGNVTLRLQNVPWDQALDIVLRTKGLDKRREDNVIIVAPTEELAAREKAELAARKDVQELAPLRTEYVQVNYAKAADLAGLIKSQGGSNSLLSERGSVCVDERTNTLLVQDTADRLRRHPPPGGTLDIPIRQVLIEARIVVVSDDFSRDLGVRFGATAIGDQQSLGFGGTNSAGVVSSSGVGREDDDIVLQPNNNNAPGGTPPAISLPAVNDRYMVNLPVANPAGRIALMLLDSDFIVDLELSAAQAEGRGEDRLGAARGDGEPARSSHRAGHGNSVPGSSSSGATTIQFKKAVLALKVTPQITPDNRIIMDLTVSKDSVGQVIVTSFGVNVPSSIRARSSRRSWSTTVRRWCSAASWRPSSAKLKTRCPGWATSRASAVLFKNKSKTEQQGRAPDLRYAEDPARGREPLLTPRARKLRDNTRPPHQRPRAL